MQHQKILILDFGSQVTQLIARRVREAGGVAGVAIEHHNLRPGERTLVFVIRREVQP